MAELTRSQTKEVKKEVKKVEKKLEKKIEKKLEKQLDKEVDKQVKKALHKQVASKISSKAKFIHSTFKDHASTAIIAAFSFLIAIAWKDLIVSLVKNAFDFSMFERYPYLPDLFSAVIVTIVAIIAIALVSRWANKA